MIKWLRCKEEKPVANKAFSYEQGNERCFHHKISSIAHHQEGLISAVTEFLEPGYSLLDGSEVYLRGRRSIVVENAGCGAGQTWVES